MLPPDDDKAWLRNVLKEAEDAQGVLESIRRPLVQGTVARLRRLAGTELDTVDASCQSILDSLASADTWTRIASLYLLIERYDFIDGLLGTCMEIAEHDDDVERRLIAFTLLPRLSGMSPNDVERLLATVVSNEKESVSVRSAAYRSLLRLASGYQIPVSLAKIRFPDDVDWELVRSHLGEVP